MKNINKPKFNSLLPKNNEAGGNIQEWKREIVLGKNKVTISTPKWEDGVIRNSKFQNYDVGIIRKIDSKKLLYPLTVDFSRYETNEELYCAVKTWWIETKKKAEKTIDVRIRTARQFERHPVFPVDWLIFDEKPEQVINLLMYLENVEYKEKGKELDVNNYGVNHIHNLWKTIRTFAEARGVDISYWPYRPPERPENKVKIIPMPPMVNKLIHHKYAKAQYANKLIKTILTIGFQSGLRPEEIIILKVKNIDFESGTIIITEQKKRHRNRQIRLEKPVMYSRQQNSLKNWIYIWRKKKTNDDGFLFLKPNGKPFETVADLRGFLADYVKPVWNDFCPKIMRDWYAIAKMIQYMEKNGSWQIRKVKNKLGHKKQDTTEIYVEFAEMYYENFKFDWLKSVLKFHPNSKRMKKLVKEDYRSSQENLSKRKKWAGLIKFPSVGNYAPVGIRTRV